MQNLFFTFGGDFKNLDTTFSNDKEAMAFVALGVGGAIGFFLSASVVWGDGRPVTASRDWGFPRISPKECRTLRCWKRRLQLGPGRIEQQDSTAGLENFR